MPITASNIKLLASARMVDADDGGGQMAGTGLQDGVENNVFPDISTTDRAFGRLALRKVYPAVLDTSTDPLLGAHVILADMPDDAAVRAFAFSGVGATEDRAGALARLGAAHWEPLGPGGTGVITWTGLAEITTALPLSPGLVVYTWSGAEYVDPVLLLTATNTGGNVWAVTYDGVRTPANYTPPGVGGGFNGALGVPSTITPRLATTRPVTGTLAIGDTHCDVGTLLASVVPKTAGSAAGSAAQTGIDPTAALPGGVAVAFRAGDGLVVHHTGEVAPATYANGNTVDVGRTGVASFRLVGADGLSITAGWSGDLPTGVVTISDISGWAQPVRVRHTIEEVLACSRTGYPEVSGGSSSGGASQASAPFALSLGLTMYCGRPNVGSIRVISRAGQDITGATWQFDGLPSPGPAPLFNVDLAAGAVTFSAASDPEVSAAITSHSPVTLVTSGSYSSVSTPSALQATLNRITFNRPLTRAFPAGTLVSSMLLLGDLQARAGAAFSQEAWTSVWADSRIGPAIVPQYQGVTNPIAVTNQGAISERWAAIFITSTTFRLVGQTTGQIANGDVNSVLAPINPATGVPYFTLQPAGWGAWAAGNVLRFNTVGANAPVWTARAVLPSAPSSAPDSLTVAVRGDIDA